MANPTTEMELADPVKNETAFIDADDYQEWCEAVSQDLQQLAVLHDREADKDLITALREVEFPYNLGFPPLPVETLRKANILATEEKPKSKDDTEETRELIEPQRFFATALEELPAELSQKELDNLAVDYADIYLTHSLHASPFESVWLDEDHLLQQEPMFKIREWYKRYNLGIADRRVRSEDHLVLQLQFIALLLDPEASFASEIPLQKRFEDAARFMDEHLMLWLPDFCLRVAQRCRTDFYASSVVLTHTYMEQLRDTLAEITQVDRPSAEEIAQQLVACKPVVEEPISFMPGVTESW